MMNAQFRITAGALILTAASAIDAHATQDTRVLNAVKARNDAALTALLAKKVDVNTPQPDGATPLHWAAHLGDLATVERLLAAGARPNPVNAYGVTPLSLAATNGHAPIIEALLKAGASVDTALPTGETPLMTAARAGALPAVSALLSHKASVNTRESVMGQSALMWAIAEGHLDVATALIDAGAEVTAASTSGFTPLLFAVREGHLDAVTLLLARGATVGETAKDGHSALHIAVVRGHVALARFLLDRGADPNAAGPGYAPLHWVAGTWETIHTHDYVFNPTAVNHVKEWSVLAGIPSQQDKHDLITALLAKGADVNARLTKAPPRYGFTLFKTALIVGATPLYLAAQVADVPTMKLLLSKGADPKAGANDGTTLLMVAAGMARVDTESVVPEADHIAAVRLALELGHDVNAANNAGNTAMHAATVAGFDHLVRLLAERGANINPRNKKGDTPLRLANYNELDGMVYTRPSTAALLKALGGSE